MIETIKTLRLICILLAGSVIAACGGDNGPASPTLTGNWEKYAEVNSGSSTDPATVVFSDSTYEVFGLNCQETGNYTIAGNFITVTTGSMYPGYVGEQCGINLSDNVLFNLNHSTLVIFDHTGVKLWRRPEAPFSGRPLSGLWKSYSDDALVLMDDTFAWFPYPGCSYKGTFSLSGSSITLSFIEEEGCGAIPSDSTEDYSYSGTSLTIGPLTYSKAFPL